MSSGPPPLKRVGSTAQRLAEKPYEKRVCRIEAHYPPPPTGELLECPTPEEYVDAISAAGFEVAIVSGAFNRGTPRFPSRIFAPHPHLDQDLNPRFIELCHRRGIIVLSYYPINFSKPLRDLHPEWLMQFVDDGRPFPENQGWFCFNSPFRDWLPECLSDFMDNLDIDGFYFDDVNWGSHDEAPYVPSCCCRFCARQFNEDTGFDIPRKVDFDSMAFRHFVNWRYDKLIEFLHHLFGSVRSRYPDAVLDLNTYYWPAAEWSQGHPIASLRLHEVGGHSFVETFPAPHRYLREPGFVAKVLRASGTPFGLFRVPSEPLKGFGLAPYPRGHEAAVFAAVAMAHGGASCGEPLPGRVIKGGNIFVNADAHRRVFDGMRQREDYLEGESLKYLALHYSTRNRDFNPGEIHRGPLTGPGWRQLHQRYVHGTYEMLNRSHLPLDLAFDEHIVPGHLGQYGLLFLSNSACLSDAQCEAIAAYVDGGGTLIATCQTSLLDELGYDRGRFGLEKVLGVEYAGTREKTGEDGQKREEGPIALVPQEERLRKEMGDIICMYGREAKIRTRGGVEILCTRSNLEDVNPLDRFHPQRPFDSGEPAVVVNRFGRGRAYYLAADVGSAFMESPYAMLKRFVVHLVRRTTAPFEIEAPEALEITAAVRPSGELMVHLVNNPNPLIPWRIYNEEDFDNHRDDGAFHAPRELVPLRDIVVRFTGLEVKSARLPLQGRNLEIDSDVVLVPRVELHEVLVLEVEDE